MTGTGVDAAASAPAPVPVGRTQVLDVDEVGGRVERTELPGGLRVLTETMPGVLSATLGIWVGVGSRDEEPSDAVHDLFAETLYGGTALGRSVLGSVESIENLSRDDVDGWYRGRYRLPSIVVTAAGRVDHQQVLDLVTAAFDGLLSGDER